MEFAFGATWIDPAMGDRPFIMGRVKKASDGKPHPVKFLIDTGSDSTSIPKEILDNIMKALMGKEVKIKRQHQTFVNTNAYEDVSFQIKASVHELQGETKTYKYTGEVLAQIGSDYGVLGTDVLEALKITGIELDWEKWEARLWRKPV